MRCSGEHLCGMYKTLTRPKHILCDTKPHPQKMHHMSAYANTAAKGHAGAKITTKGLPCIEHQQLQNYNKSLIKVHHKGTATIGRCKIVKTTYFDLYVFNLLYWWCIILLSERSHVLFLYQQVILYWHIVWFCLLQFWKYCFSKRLLIWLMSGSLLHLIVFE